MDTARLEIDTIRSTISMKINRPTQHGTIHLTPLDMSIISNTKWVKTFVTLNHIFCKIDDLMSAIRWLLAQHNCFSFQVSWWFVCTYLVVFMYIFFSADGSLKNPVLMMFVWNTCSKHQEFNTKDFKSVYILDWKIISNVLRLNWSKARKMQIFNATNFFWNWFNSWLV